MAGPLGDLISDEAKKRVELIARIEKAANAAKLPEITDSMKLTPEGVEQIKETRRLIRASRVASTLPPEKFDELVERWQVFSDQTKQRLADNKENDSETKSNCIEKYNDCMNDLNCTETIPCLCCIPCSLEYARCVAGDIFAGKAGKGLFFPKDQEIANT
jgi:hypothetical protein